MADDLSQAMDQFKDLLSNEKMVETLKMMANMLAPSQNSTEKSQSNVPAVEKEVPVVPPKAAPKPSHAASPFSLDTDKIESIMKIKKIYDRISDDNDPGVNLLMALKPFLNEKRKTNLDSAIRLLGVSKLPAIMNEISIEQQSTQNNARNG